MAALIEYDRAMGAYPEHILEGFAVFRWLTTGTDAKFRDDGMTDWAKAANVDGIRSREDR